MTQCSNWRFLNSHERYSWDQCSHTVLCEGTQYDEDIVSNEIFIRQLLALPFLYVISDCSCSRRGSDSSSSNSSMLCDGSSKFLWRFLCQSHRYVWWVALSTDGLRQSSATACLQYDRAFFINLHIFPSLSLSRFYFASSRDCCVRVPDHDHGPALNLA